MKKTTTIIVVELIVIIVLFFAVISLYKVIYDKKEFIQFFVQNDASYNTHDISNNLYDTSTDVLDLAQYKNQIITETVKKYDYLLKIGEENGNGEIYIGADGKIYLTLNDDIKKLSDLEFVTLYMPVQSNNYLLVYALSKEQKVYAISLVNINLNETDFYPFQRNLKVKNFTTLNIKSDLYLPTEVVVLTTDDHLYQLSNGLKYTKNMIFENQTYYLYSNGIVTNNLGSALTDEKGFEYKVKYCISADTYFEEFHMKPTTLLITEDNKLIYTLKNDYIVYELQEKIVDIKISDGDGETNLEKMVLKFSNDETVKLSGNILKIESIDFS